MAPSLVSPQCYYISKRNNEASVSEEAWEKTYQIYNDFVQTLPNSKGWMTQNVIQYQGFCLTSTSALKGVLLVQHHCPPRPTDICLATSPKCGPTSLKVLIFATSNRSSYDFCSHPLLKNGPHDCVLFIEINKCQDYPIMNLELLLSPRLLATHIPYDLLPVAKTTFGCKLVYICRDPKDVLVSTWHFMNKLRPKKLQPLSLGEAYELFCEGISHYAPFWEHVFGDGKASLESPDKILFLKYEDMKREPSVHLRRLAEFVGQPFSFEEEEKGVVQKILRLCSFENLRNLKVNKTGVHRVTDEIVVNNCDFFRKCQTGDWENYLSDEMKQHLDFITEQKLKNSGLTLGSSNRNL
ncbi:hypothetical protein RJ640_001550 [Escallonia rubra]|uniref:Sulfotransferase n=1 Tax=Escallonia rubra TaxID=112253 RepID=A0AA88U482_9ASTE|nr:hypothetical protein RJ640_001550 [Escallonia rubra]